MDAASAFELENEEDDELLLELELVRDDEDDEEDEEDEEEEEEPVDPAEAEEAKDSPILESPPLSALDREQYDCGCWCDLPNGMIDLSFFFTSGFSVKCVLNSLVSGDSGS